MFAPRNPLAACLIPVLSLVAGALLAQPAGEAAAMPKGTLERIKVHGPSLARNLEGDDPTRDVAVYSPPGYAEDTERRYPVVYFLHGYTATAEAYVRLLGRPDSVDRGDRGRCQRDDRRAA
jgi:poly(3-hydroxybutyrate) depolymerase